MAKSRVDGDLHVTGALTANEVQLPDATVSNADVEAAAGIDATKLEHQFPLTYKDDETAVKSNTAPIYTVNGNSATIIDTTIDVVCLTAPTGGDKQFTVELKKCNAGDTSPDTVLSSPITIDDAVADCEVTEGTVNSPSLSAGDTLVIEVVASGSTGTQGQGLIVTVTLREDAA